MSKVLKRGRPDKPGEALELGLSDAIWKLARIVGAEPQKRPQIASICLRIRVVESILSLKSRSLAINCFVQRMIPTAALPTRRAVYSNGGFSSSGRYNICNRRGDCVALAQVYMESRCFQCTSKMVVQIMHPIQILYFDSLKRVDVRLILEQIT